MFFVSSSKIAVMRGYLIHLMLVSLDFLQHFSGMYSSIMSRFLFLLEKIK